MFPYKGRKTPFALNAFAYACGFSVCARLAVAKVSSVDLSRRHLDWGKRNFAPNRLNPEEHEFRRGDLFVWLRRLQRCGRRFDTVTLDLSTFLDTRREAFSKRNGTCLHWQRRPAGFYPPAGACRFLAIKRLGCPSNSLAPSKSPFGKRGAKSENASSLPNLGTSVGRGGNASLKSWWFEIL